MRTHSKLARRAGASVLVATCLTLGLLATPSVASAQSGPYWVNNAIPTVAGNGTGCAAPGYSTIQAAVNAAQTHSSATIYICPGTYAEQVQVTGTHTNLTITSAYRHLGPVLTLPATIANSTTSCDTAYVAPQWGPQPDQDGFVVCGGSHTDVNVSNLTFDYQWPNVCYDYLYGILVGGKSTLKLTHSTVVAAGDAVTDSDDGCQGGVGIQVGMAWTTPEEVGHAILSNDTISGYQKNGVTIDGQGTTASMWQDVVQGAGPIGSATFSAAAQNGIQVSNGALATITKSVVRGNECNDAAALYAPPAAFVPICGPNALESYQSIGVLFYGAAKGSLITDSTISDNDVGMYYASEKATLPSTAEVSATDDVFAANRYEGILFDQGRALVDASRVRGGNVGIMAIQYDGQAYGAFDRVTATTVHFQTVAAIQVLSDQAPTGDKPGAIIFTNCPISGPVLSNSSSYTLTFRR